VGTLFSRNHDELTLEMVTDEERDYMYRMYATDPEARIKPRNPAPACAALNNDRRKIELLNGLLLSMPRDSRHLHGDEIGMGENIYLGIGIRAHSDEWSADRNAGSPGKPQKLYLPSSSIPSTTNEAFNVETLQDNPDSLRGG